MDIILDIRKTLEENAATYFEASKKSKRKLAGAEKAVERTKLQLQILLEKQEIEEKAEEKTEAREKKWYEKFRWFISSEGLLCIGGRDATTNEIVVKKHTEKDDIIFHTEMRGSPFFVIKAEGKRIGRTTLDETAIATASFSRAWKLGLSHAEVFYVKPEQLTKTPKPGEYLEKGSFIVTGKTTKQTVDVKLAIGVLDDHSIMCAPLTAVKKNCKKYLIVSQGKTKASDAAKFIKKKLGGEIDDIVRVLPSGGCRIIEA